MMKKPLDETDEEILEKYKKDPNVEIEFDDEGLPTKTSVKVNGKRVLLPSSLTLKIRDKKKKTEAGKTTKNSKDLGVSRQETPAVFEALLAGFDPEKYRYEIREKPGWQATYENPIPRVRCTAIAKSTGEQCARTARAGLMVCDTHGGSRKVNQRQAQRVIEAARERLINLTDGAVNVIEDILQDYETSSAVRLKAATTVLDRTGIGPKTEQKVEVEHKLDVSSDIRKKLEAMARDRPAIESTDTVVNAEIVE